MNHGALFAIAFFTLLSLSACQSLDSPEHSKSRDIIEFRAASPGVDSPSPTDNTLTAAEKEDGWKLLFDGKSLKGWKMVQGWSRATPEKVPAKVLRADEGSLVPSKFGGYMIIYNEIVGDYVLKIDFKLMDTGADYSCNSGIFLRTYPLILQDDPNSEKPYDIGYNGIELALDQTPKNGYTDTGALYGIARPLKQVVRPNGQWNQAIITNHENLITVTLNGELINVVDLDQFTEPGKIPNGQTHKFGPQKVFRNHPRRGYFGMQDHGCAVRFKNLKVLLLD